MIRKGRSTPSSASQKNKKLNGAYVVDEAGAILALSSFATVAGLDGLVCVHKPLDEWNRGFRASRASIIVTDSHSLIHELISCRFDKIIELIATQMTIQNDQSARRQYRLSYRLASFS